MALWRIDVAEHNDPISGELLEAASHEYDDYQTIQPGDEGFLDIVLALSSPETSITYLGPSPGA